MSVYQWIGGNTADLGSGSNWVDTTEPGMGQPPGVNDDAIVEVGMGLYGTLNVAVLDLVQTSGASPISITGPSTNVTAGSVQIAYGFTLDDGAYLNAGTLGIDGSGTVVTVQNNADLYVSATGANDVFTIGASTGKASLLITRGGFAEYNSLQASGTLDLGGVSGSTATMTVSADGDFGSTLSSINIGAASGATAALNVTGAGSEFEVDNYGNTTIGDYGELGGTAQGSVSVTSGGYASLSSDGEVDLGTTAGMAKISVSGANSAVAAGPVIEIGVEGTNVAGEILVSAGGEFDAANDVELNNGLISVTGANSLLNTRELDTDSGTTIQVGTGGLIHVTDFELGGNLKLTAGSVNVRAGLYLDGGNEIVGYGTIAATTIGSYGLLAASGGTLDVKGAVSRKGTGSVAAASTLEFDAAVASAQTVSFKASTGTLLLDDAPAFAGTVAQLVAGDTIDVGDIKSATVSYVANSQNTGGILTAKSGTTTAKLSLTGVFIAAGFHTAADGGSGTAITYKAPANPTLVVAHA